MVEKFTGGIRVNFAKRGSYYARCMGAGLVQISGASWYFSPWKNKFGKHFKSAFKRRKKCCSAHCLQYEGSSKKRRKVDNAGPDMVYGPSAAEGDIPVCKWKVHTSDHGLVKSILYHMEINSNAIHFGRVNENVANNSILR
ncbi:hypothetical protein PR048_015069 [Dryococelus australis]|uniref:Uncharacterized protein n=1 Tax=Dryococelus australis TaxID=614101 RepID=A0ABQ9HFZ7_9NEOP|nr:hypothetical protein PR048_015069 [Dryococelus australis]